MELSRRGYARSRNISEATVRKHITSGLLAPAVLPNKLIDAERADALLAGSITRPKAKKVPAVLAAAKARHQRAIARDVFDQLSELREALISPALAERSVNGSTASAWAIARAWPAEVAPTVAGKPAAEVQRTLKQAVNDLLGAMHDQSEQEAATNAERRAAARLPEPDINTLTPVELTALTENARAEILELLRLERQQLKVRVEDVIDVYVEALSVSKSLLNAIPGRTSQLIAISDPAEAERLLAVEIDAFCRAGRRAASSLLRSNH
jgi:hypothetical protein